MSLWVPENRKSWAEHPLGPTIKMPNIQIDGHLLHSPWLKGKLSFDAINL